MALKCGDAMNTEWPQKQCENEQKEDIPNEIDKSVCRT